MPTPPTILILGGGIAGLTTALALTKFTPKTLPPPCITVYEIRPSPATLGGAVNLTPNALRLLSHLGALSEIHALSAGAPCPALEVFDLYSGAKLAESSFRGPEGKGLGDPPFMALRITRGESLKGVLAAVGKCANIQVVCGKKTVGICEDELGVEVRFEDGECVRGDMLLGCDGIHSVVRGLLVDPERKSVYSGICNAFGFAERRVVEASSSSSSAAAAAEEKEESTSTSEPASPSPIYEPTHFHTSAMNLARRGVLLTSFHSPARNSIYVGALMQVPELASRDGWKAAGRDAAAIRADMQARYASAAHPLIEHVIADAQDLFLWPVFTLSKGGRWATERVMLLGDAAHAMPPQGESTGIVFEDGVLFARCVGRWRERGEGVSVKEAFEAYERLRRGRIDVAFDESQTVLRTVNDAGWVGHWVKKNVVPWYLWWTGARREKHFVEDVTTCELGY